MTDNLIPRHRNHRQNGFTLMQQIPHQRLQILLREYRGIDLDKRSSVLRHAGAGGICAHSRNPLEQIQLVDQQVFERRCDVQGKQADKGKGDIFVAFIGNLGQCFIRRDQDR